MAALQSVRRLRYAVLLLVAGCATAQSDKVLENQVLSVEAPPAVAASWDGWYEGRQVSVDPPAVCRARDRTVWFRVRGQEIEMYASRHRRSAVRRILLDGSVAADGRLVLRAQALDRSVSGLIRGDRLTASDLPDDMDVAMHRRSCTYRYEATRSQAE